MIYRPAHPRGRAVFFCIWLSDGVDAGGFAERVVWGRSIHAWIQSQGIREYEQAKAVLAILKCCRQNDLWLFSLFHVDSMKMNEALNKQRKAFLLMLNAFDRPGPGLVRSGVFEEAAAIYRALNHPFERYAQAMSDSLNSMIASIAQDYDRVLGSPRLPLVVPCLSGWTELLGSDITKEYARFIENKQLNDMWGGGISLRSYFHRASEYSLYS